MNYLFLLKEFVFLMFFYPSLYHVVVSSCRVAGKGKRKIPKGNSNFAHPSLFIMLQFRTPFSVERSSN